LRRAEGRRQPLSVIAVQCAYLRLRRADENALAVSVSFDGKIDAAGETFLAQPAVLRDGEAALDYGVGAADGRMSGEGSSRFGVNIRRR
jgi:hypothetical protein